MSLLQTRKREIMGPYPGSFAVMARPTNTSDLEALFRARNEAEIERQAIEARSRVQQKEDLRSEWEQKTNEKIFAKSVIRKVEDMKRSENVELEVRRDRLREKLRSEEDALIAEVEASKETTIERQAKMRQRVKELREVREKERIANVTARYEQQFRENCDEVRQDLQMRNLRSVVQDRNVQLEERHRQKMENQRTEEIWAHQWEQDRMAKERKEEAEERDRAYKNRDRLSILSQQMNALAAQKDEENRIKQEEGRIMKEQEAMRQLEALQEKYATIRTAERYKSDLRRCKRMALQREVQRQREELALDLEMLERLDKEIKDDLAKQMNTKKRLHDELESYMAYLAADKKAKEEEEEAINRLAEAEVENAWKKREAQWAKERAARGKLLSEVIASWNNQIAAHKEANRRADAILAEEQKQFQAVIDANKREEAEYAAQMQMRTKTYADDLISQIDFNKGLALEKETEEDKMYQNGVDEENEYRRKVQFVLNNPDHKRTHPVRIKNMELNI